jgi:hypothetical protein
MYYCENYSTIEKIVDELDSNLWRNCFLLLCLENWLTWSRNSW